MLPQYNANALFLNDRTTLPESSRYKIETFFSHRFTIVENNPWCLGGDRSISDCCQLLENRCGNSLEVLGNGNFPGCSVAPADSRTFERSCLI